MKIDRTVKVNTWEDMKHKYPMERKEMTREQEQEWLADCYFLYEKEGFARCFWSQADDNKKYHEKPFIVIRRTEEKDGFDMECLPAWRIQFEDGEFLDAYPDEIIPSEMIRNGCKIENLKCVCKENAAKLFRMRLVSDIVKFELDFEKDVDMLEHWNGEAVIEQEPIYQVYEIIGDALERNDTTKFVEHLQKVICESKKTEPIWKAATELLEKFREYNTDILVR